MTPTIRPISVDELPAFIETMTTAFHERPDVSGVAAEVASLWDVRRCRAAFDGGTICGTFRTWGTELTVPGGGVVPGAAVAGVTSPA